MDRRKTVDWKMVLIVKLPRKGDTIICNKWLRITILSVPGKILSRIIFNCIEDTMDTCLWKKQVDF
jgi:hypothetical protein